MSRVSSINRSGSVPRLISYTQSHKERNFWDFQKPPSEILPYEINGKGKKYINTPISGEINNFRNKHIFPQPNTKRTINPFYAPKEKIIPKSKSSLNINEYKYQNNNNFLHSSFLNNKLFPSKKRNTNLYKNNFSIDNNDEISKYMNNNNNNDFYEDPYSKKRQIKNSLFNHYKTTTQIINLPGGIKRNQKEINDDKSTMDIKPKTKLNYPSFSLKIKEDFKSNVSCLPNTMTKYYEIPKKIKPPNPKRYANNDIFLRKNMNHNYNYFNNSTGKKFNKFKQNNDECRNSSDMYSYNNGIRTHYRNYSQFSLG